MELLRVLTLDDTELSARREARRLARTGAQQAQQAVKAAGHRSRPEVCVRAWSGVLGVEGQACQTPFICQTPFDTSQNRNQVCLVTSKCAGRACTRREEGEGGEFVSSAETERKQVAPHVRGQHGEAWRGGRQRPEP